MFNLYNLLKYNCFQRSVVTSLIVSIFSVRAGAKLLRHIKDYSIERMIFTNCCKKLILILLNYIKIYKNYKKIKFDFWGFMF